MKKRLLGMILTFVVMMIIPLAISAADPALSATSFFTETPEEGQTITVKVAVDGTVNLSVNATKAVTFERSGDANTSFTKSDDNKSFVIEGEKVGTSTYTFTTDKKTLTLTVNVVAKDVVDFSITGTRTTIENGATKNHPNITLIDQVTPGDAENRFYVGDTFTVTGGTVYYNSGETKTLPPAEIIKIKTTTGETTTSQGIDFTATDRVVTFFYKGVDPNPSERSETQTAEKTFRVGVEARKKTLQGIEWNPDVKVEDRITVYDAGVKFDYTQIRLKFKEEGTNETKYVYYSASGSSNGFTPKEPNLAMYVGIQSFVIKYDNEDYTFNFSDLGITTVEAKTVIPYIKEKGTTVYYYGDKFNFDDLELDVTHKGDTGDLTYTVKSDGFKYPDPLRISEDTKGITITYDTKSYTWTWDQIRTRTGEPFQVLEDTRVLTGIRVEGTPLYSKYTEGMTVTDWSGLKFYAVYTATYFIPGFGGGTTAQRQVEKLLSEEEMANIKAFPCEYSKYDPEKNTYIVIEYTEGQTTVRGYAYGFNIVEKKVSGISVATPPKKSSYEKNDILNLEGLEIRIQYDNGTSEVHAYDDPHFTCSPKHGDVLSASASSVMIVYKNGDVTVETVWDGLQVNSAVKIKRASISVKPDKLVYEVGEKFNPSGIEITLIYDDDNFPDEILTVDNNRYLREYSKTFRSLKDTTVTFIIPNPHNAKDSKSVELAVTVKEKVVPSSIENVTYRKTYLAGEYASLEKDITDFTVIMSDGSKLEKADVDKLVKAGSATFKFATVEKLKTSTKKLTLSFKYKDTTITKDLTIEVKEPVCLLETAGTTISETPYDNFELALEAANALSTSEAKKVTIILAQDVELSEKYQFNAERSIGIDLNGHNLTMAQNQMIVPHKTSYKNVTITLLNSSSTDATIIYDKEDKDMWIVLGKGDELVITWETEVPGIYTITLTAGEGGKISGPTEVAHGNDAKYTITPDKGYEIAEVFVDKVSKGKGATVTLLSVDEEHEIVVAFQEVIVEWQNPFKDVYKSAGYYKAIEFVYENNLFKGVSANEFEPNETMTRAMFVTVLGRLYGISENDSRYAGKTSFSDVKVSAATNWYVPYVEWATQSGLLLGYEDGTFRPDNEISHTEMYILMERYARMILGVSASATGTRVTVSDAKDIPTWEGAYEAVQFATKYDFLVKTGTKIYPNSDAKRHELASLLLNFCDSFGLMEAEDEK